MRIFNIEKSDAKIIEDIRQGGQSREAAVRYLIDKNIGFVYKLHRKLRIEESLAKDAYLDAIIAVMQQIENGVYRGENKISSYLYQIFYFKSVDIIRKKATNAEDYIDIMPERMDEVNDVSQNLEQKESVFQITQILEKIGQPCKQILMDWGFWGYSIQEIAERLNIDDPVKVSRRKYKCLEELKERLEGSKIL
jgi:RNA polymerase sigma-70 factor (ECF subfamily)